MEYYIRRETPWDIGAITTIHDRAFGQQTEGKLVKALRRRPGFDAFLSLVAIIGETPIGHILFTPVKIRGPVDEVASAALAPMAVLPAYQGRGVGSALVRAGLEKARGRGFTSVNVLGHPAYYPRFGFQPASNWGILCPWEVPDEAFMILELEKDALKEVAGVVIYPPEFDHAI